MSLYDTRDVRTWADEAALPGIAELLWEEGVDGARLATITGLALRSVPPNSPAWAVVMTTCEKPLSLTHTPL